MILHRDPVDDSDLHRALVVMAHPDDVDHLAAGTVSAWTSAGVDVTYCIVTDGSAGGRNPTATRVQVADIREGEQRAAATVVGVQDVRFLGYRDGALVNNPDLRRALVRVIRQVRPQRIVIQSPEINWEFLPDAHPDHRACGDAALQAVYLEARNPRAHPDLLAVEGLDAWTVPQLWMVGSPAPNHFVDVTHTFDDKLTALRAHMSQIDDEATISDSLRARLAQQAGRGGLPLGHLAEEFHVVRTHW